MPRAGGYTRARMKVWLNGSSRGRKIDRSAVRRDAKTILSALGFLEAELSVSLTSDSEIAELAGRYGRPAAATDVLAFALAEGGYTGSCLGDVIISIDSAERQARDRKLDLDRELRDLLIHGVLHLMGMDHQRAADTRAMRALEDHLRWQLADLA